AGWPDGWGRLTGWVADGWDSALGPSAPHLGETGLVRLAPQRHPACLLGLLGEVLVQARLFDAPARRGAQLRAAQPPGQHEGDDLVHLDAEQLRDLGGREEPRRGCGRIGHGPILPRPVHICRPPPGLWITPAAGPAI